MNRLNAPVRRRPFWPVLILPCMLAACSTVPSDAVRTRGISASYRVVQEVPGKVDLHATFRVGDRDSLTFVELEGGERVTAQLDGREIGLARWRGLFGQTGYRADAAWSAEPGAVTRFVLRRNGEPVLTSAVGMPPTLSVEFPGAGAAQRWAPGGRVRVLAWASGSTAGLIDLSLDLDCVEQAPGRDPARTVRRTLRERDLPDRGTWWVDLARWQARDPDTHDLDQPVLCEAQATVSKRTRVVDNPGFRSIRTTAKRKRVVRFQVRTRLPLRKPRDKEAEASG